MSLMFSSRQATACATYRPLPGLEICADCRWNGAAHQADTSQPAVTRDGVTTQVVKRAAILTPDTSGLVLDSPGILAAVETMKDRRAEWRAATSAPRPTGRRARTVYDDRCTDAEIRYDFARCDVERAVRVANRGASEAQIMAACRSL